MLCPCKFLYPKPIIFSHFLNFILGDLATALVDIKVENISCRGQHFKSSSFSMSWTQDPIYAPPWYVMVVNEGPLTNLFVQSTLSPYSLAGTSDVCLNATPNDEERQEILKGVFQPTGNHAKDIILVEIQGLQIDDDNNPAPKSILGKGELPLMANLHPCQIWGWDGIGQRQVVIHTKTDASFGGD